MPERAGPPALAWASGLPAAGTPGPRIALVHGLLAGAHMQRNLLRTLREAGFADTTLHGNHGRPQTIADDLATAVAAGRPVALIGYSQGGFQAVKAARLLAARGLPVDLLVTVAAGGFGRWYPPQWGVDPRRIPDNVRLCLNYHAADDVMGSDRRAARNLASAAGSGTRLENIRYPEGSGIDHVGIVRSWPPERVHPDVNALFLQRLLRELALLAA